MNVLDPRNRTSQSLAACLLRLLSRAGVERNGCRRVGLPQPAPFCLVVALLCAAMQRGQVSAQPFPGSVPTRDVVVEPMLHIDATVYKLMVQGVDEDGTLWVDFEGRPVRVHLEDILLAAAETDPGREARKRLGRFVGRWVRFSFRGGDQPVRVPAAHEAANSAAQPDARSVPQRGRGKLLVAYAPIIDHLLESGLARYCPGAGRRSVGLEEVEQRARAHGIGMWHASAIGTPPRCEKRR